MNQWKKMITDLKEQGLTQTQIATEIKCSQNYVSNLENGLCGSVLVMRRVKILKNYGQSTANPIVEAHRKVGFFITRKLPISFHIRK